MLGVVASIAGLLAGLGFSQLLGGLFDAAGMGIPRGAMELAPRTDRRSAWSSASA